MKKIPFNKDVYVISDNPDTLIQAVKDGSKIIQLRDKSDNLEKIAANASKILPLKKEYDFNFIINDFPQLAVKLGADGVHVGQEDLTVPEVRAIVGNDFIIGKTTHNLDQGKIAEDHGADYISVGPVYATPTKPGRPAVGLEYIKQASLEIKIPFVTIGGIDLTNLDDVLMCGARTIGIVRAAGETPVFLRRIEEFYKNES